MSASVPTYTPPPPPPEPRRRRRGGVVGPMLLIFLGGVFLLQNTGYLPPNYWLNLWRLWPLVLVLAGVELLLAHRIPWLAVAALTAAVLVLGSVATLSTAPYTPPATATIRTVPTNLGGASQAAVTVQFGAGQLSVGPLVQPGSEQLALMTYEGPAEMAPRPSYEVSRGGVGQLEYEVSGRGPGFLPFASGRGDAPRMEVGLNPSVQITKLTVQSGAADAKLDLTTLRVSSLDVSVGAAAATIRLPEKAGMTTARVSGGAATIVVEIPQDVAARIRHRGGLSTLTVDVTRFPSVGEGDVYESPDYATAQNRVELNLETGITTVQVT